MNPPDFKHLGITTLWSATDWHQAWDVLADKRNWPLVVEFATMASHPAHEADRINKAAQDWRDLK